MTAFAVYFDAPLRYDQAARIQEALVAARIENTIPDVVLFLEHEPVITLGNRGRRNHLLADEAQLQAMGIEIAHAARGGDVTFHGPGQLVMYPILKLGSREADAHGYLYNLEEIAIRTSATFGVTAYRRDGMNGAWTDAGKLAAIGFRLKKWVTYHGMSFNVDGNLDGFQTIVPCGLVGERVASLKTVLGPACPSLAQVRDAMARHFEEVCDRGLERYPADGDLPSEVAGFMSQV